MPEAPKILMVCLGNICRSPMAEGVLKSQLKEQNISTLVDSAGTGDWHSGEHPDARAIKTMKRHHIDISNLTARQFIKNDFDQFDLILAMDESNLKDILKLCNDPIKQKKVQLILAYAPDLKTLSVPDPWYGDLDGFEQVFHMLDNACKEIIKSHFK